MLNKTAIYYFAFFKASQSAGEADVSAGFEVAEAMSGSKSSQSAATKRGSYHFENEMRQTHAKGNAD